MRSNPRSRRRSNPFLTALLNEITTIPDNFILVLDDYHVIDAKRQLTAPHLSDRAPAAANAPGHHHP